MKTRDARLTTENYVTLKNKLYRVYVSDLEKPEDKKIERMYKAIAPYMEEMPVVKEIVNDTIEFPYDRELSDFFYRNKNMKLNDLVLTASNLFDIDTDLVISKMNEYTLYEYHNLLCGDIFDTVAIGKITRHYREQNKEKSK